MRNKNQNVYTVGQVNSYIKNIFDQDYMLRRIYVSGEVSNCKYHPSGHIYFSLKDAEGTISCHVRRFAAPALPSRCGTAIT